MQALCDAHPKGLLVLGEGMEVLGSNAESRALLGLGEAGALRPDLRDLLPPDAQSQALLAQVEQCRKRGRATFDLQRDQHHATLALRAVELGGLQGVLLLCERADKPSLARALHAAQGQLEELQNTQNTLTSENRLLEHVSRMRGEMMANFSHDLRTPLTSVRGHIEIVLRTGNLSEAQQHSLRVALRGIDRTLGMVTDHQHESQATQRPDLGHPQEFDLGALVADVVGLVSLPAAQDGVAIQLHRPAHEPTSIVARGNQSQLHRLLTNLLGNARKFTPRGGRVDVSLSHAPQEQRADLQARQQRAREDAQRKDHAFAQTPLGGWVHLRVEDTGCGIAPENLPRIFERYFTVTHKHNRGSGLGLNICQSIAHHHGGFIEVQSQLGVGTSFDVWLPIVQEEEVHTPRSLVGPPLVLPSATLHPRHRVVALDDDYDTRDLLQVVLTSANMEVETLSDERGLVASLAAPTSILLVDFTLPRARGDELIARLRANPAYADLPIMVLSARDDVATRAACVAAGATDFVSKPFEVSNLIARIRQHSRLLSQPQPGSAVAGG